MFSPNASQGWKKTLAQEMKPLKCHVVCVWQWCTMENNIWHTHVYNSLWFTGFVSYQMTGYAQ